MATFKNHSDDLMETAIHLVIMSCRTWPTVADINNAVDELQRDIRMEPQLQRLPSRSDFSSPLAQKVFEVIKNDKAKEYLAQVDISPVKKYALTKFPDMTDDTIRRNYNELHTAMTSLEKCRGCQWQNGKCDTNGFYIVPMIAVNGWVKTEYAMCPKHSLYQKGGIA